MRKLLLIGLLFLSLFTQAQFGWSGLSSNQWVSFQDAQGSGIYQKIPMPNGTNWMTKGGMMYYLDVDTSYLVGKPSNQWITKLQMVGNSATNTINWYYTTDLSPTGDYMKIFINGTIVVNSHISSFNSTSGSFTAHSGDSIKTEVYTSIPGNFSKIQVNGNQFTRIVASGGYTTTTFMWIGSYGATSISGINLSGAVPYSNSADTTQRIKNNCPSGYTGSVVNYIVPYGTYVSYISQINADNQAYADLNINAQAYANANGSCIAIPSPGSPGCTNSLIVSYNPSPAQDYGDGLVYLAYILINGYEIDTKAVYATRYNKPIHDGDSIVIKIHMPPSTKGITGVNINYKDDSNKSLLQIASVVVSATTAGLGQFLLSTFLNVLSFGLSQGTTTQIHDVVTVPYDIYIRMRYSCDKGDINITINNMIDIN